MTKATLCLIAVFFIVFTFFGPAQTGKSHGKGQLISKCSFGVFKSTKKNKNCKDVLP